MSLTDQILSALSEYGVLALFSILTISSAGMPFPSTLMLIAAGSFASAGELNLALVLILGSAGAILGDQIGYAIGRWGGRRLAVRLSRWFGGEARLKRAEETANSWGGWGIFLSRWLITPLGPPLNLTSGMAGYPWPRFLLFDALGEILWVVLYVTLGYIFSDQVEELSDTLGDVTWVILGSAVAAVLGWKLVQRIRGERSGRAKLLVDSAS